MHRLPVRGLEAARRFVEAVGFCTWGPVPGVDFPNLAEAMGHTAWTVMGETWGWKDDIHFQHRLYYARVIAGQPSFIAPDFLPDFVAALGVRGSAERDPLALYESGRLARPALQVYECLREEGRQSSAVLRHVSGSRTASALERALTELQRRFLICKVDVTGRTRGTYGYVWDLAERFWPEEFNDAARTAQGAARARLRSRLTQFGLNTAEEGRPERERKLFLWAP